jgi:Fe-S cluster biogenesis protein NfuA
MTQDASFEKRIQRIGELVEQIESAADPNARTMAKELLESLMALHGAAIERLLELTSDSETGAALIRKFGRDDLVGSVLLLYGLHPEGLQTRVNRALEKTRAFLESHSSNAEVVSIHDDGTVTVRLDVRASAGCASSSASIKSTLEAALQNAAPDATSIVVEETGASLTQSGFVTVVQLQNGSSMAVLYAAPAERGAD